MGQTKVRCQFCGAKNTDEKTERCRICGGLLPDAAERRKRTSEGATFKTLVEGEIQTWQEYTDGRFEAAGKSRRPAELPPVYARTAVPGQDMASVPPMVSLADPVPQPTGTNGHSSPEVGDGRRGGLRRLFRNSDR